MKKQCGFGAFCSILLSAVIMSGMIISCKSPDDNQSRITTANTDSGSVFVSDIEDTEPESISEESRRQCVDTFVAYASGNDSGLFCEADILPLFGNVSFTDKTRPTVMEVTVPVLNETKKVTYKSTSTEEMYAGRLLMGTDGEYLYGIDEESGLLARWMKLSKTAVSDAPLTKDDLQKKADEACESIAELFTVKAGLVLTDVTENNHTYEFHYYRMVNDLASPEKIVIILTEDGTLCGYGVSLANFFADIELPDNYRELCRTAAETRLGEWAASNPEGIKVVSVDWKDDWSLHRLEDERAAITFNISLLMQKPDGTEFSSGTVRMVIPITK